MEEKTGSVWKVALNYGLITGAMLIIFTLIMYLLEIDRESSLNLLIYAFLLGGIIWGSKTYRDIYRGGFCTYGQAFTSGFLVGLVGTILFSLMMFFLFKFDAALVEKMILQAEEKIYENPRLTSDAQIESALEWARKFSTPAMIGISTFLWTTVVNLVMSLIIAIFIKKENRL